MLTLVSSCGRLSNFVINCNNTLKACSKWDVSQGNADFSSGVGSTSSRLGEQNKPPKLLNYFNTLLSSPETFPSEKWFLSAFPSHFRIVRNTSGIAQLKRSNHILELIKVNSKRGVLLAIILLLPVPIRSHSVCCMSVFCFFWRWLKGDSTSSLVSHIMNQTPQGKPLWSFFKP